MRILIVDDSMFMRHVLKTILEKHGFEVIGMAEDGTSAITLYMSLNPDAVTMDITMPGISGIETLKLIRGYDKNAKVVMISAMGNGRMIQDAILSGALNYIVKPFKEDSVMAVMNALKPRLS